MGARWPHSARAVWDEPSATPREAALKQEPAEELQSQLETASVHADLPVLSTSGQSDRKNRPSVPGSWSHGVSFLSPSRPAPLGRLRASPGRGVAVGAGRSGKLDMCAHIRHIHAHADTHRIPACTHMHTHPFTCLHTCACVQHACTHVYAYPHIHTHACVYNIYAHMYMSTSMHPHTRLPTCTLIHTRTCTTHMHTHVHVYLHAHAGTSPPHTVSGTALQISKQRPEHTAARERPGSKRPVTATGA